MTHHFKYPCYAPMRFVLPMLLAAPFDVIIAISFSHKEPIQSISLERLTVTTPSFLPPSERSDHSIALCKFKQALVYN